MLNIAVKLWVAAWIQLIKCLKVKFVEQLQIFTVNGTAQNTFDFSVQGALNVRLGEEFVPAVLNWLKQILLLATLH